MLIKKAEMRPELMVMVRDLSNVKTRWRTNAVAMSMESSSPKFVSYLFRCEDREGLHHCV